MNFDNIPTRRSPWQSVDVGISIHQKWSYQAWLLTILIMAPIYLTLRIMSIFVFDSFAHAEIFGNFPLNLVMLPFRAFDMFNGLFQSEDNLYMRFFLSNIHIVMLIWLKPIYERISMLLYSKKLFGEELSQHTLLKLFLNSLKHGVILDLTLRRFNPLRHFTAPINILEQQKGSARRKRINNLMSSCGSTITSAYIALMGIEIFALIGITAVYWTFTSSLEINIFLMIIMDFLTFVTLTYFTSLSSAIGFSIYINQRNQLEAWDIEKTISKALTSLKQKSKFLAPAFLLLFLSIPPEHLYANSNFDSVETKNTTDNGAKTNNLSIKQRLNLAQANEVFHKITTTKEFKDKNKDNDKPKNKDNKTNEKNPFEPDQNQKPPQNDFDKNHSNNNRASNSLQFIVLSILAIGIMLVLYKYKDAIQHFSHIEKKQSPQNFDSGLIISKESLPKDLISTVERHFANNEPRLGVSLLYRGALSSLFYDFSIEFDKSDTEQICLEHVKNIQNKPLITFFNELTHAWINLAYGHIEIDDKQQTHLIKHWPTYFQNKQVSP